MIKEVHDTIKTTIASNHAYTVLNLNTLSVEEISKLVLVAALGEGEHNI